MKIEPLSPSIGARVSGVNLAQPLPEETWRAIKDAWRTRHLLVFPGQTLEPEHQVAFCERIGPVLSELQTGMRYVHISNKREDGILKEGLYSFHIDFSFLSCPVDAICLYGIAIPAEGTETLFASNAAALTRMPASLLDTLRTLTVRNVGDFTRVEHDIIRHKAGRAPESAIAREHKLVWRHPRTNIELLYCCQQHSERFLELTDADSVRLFDEIYAYLYAPENMYSHAWNKGDLVIWDNLALQHGRPHVSTDGAERTLRRVTVAQEDPVKELLARMQMSTVGELGTV